MKNLLQILSAFTIFSMTSFLAANVYAGPVDPGGADMGLCVQKYGEGTNRTSVCYGNDVSDICCATTPDNCDAECKTGSGSGGQGGGGTDPVGPAACRTSQACSDTASDRNQPIVGCSGNSDHSCYGTGGELYGVYSCKAGCQSGYVEENASIGLEGACAGVEISIKVCTYCANNSGDCETNNGTTTEPEGGGGAYTITTTINNTWDRDKCTCNESTTRTYSCNAGYFGSGSNCTQCPDGYPNGGGNNTEDTSCYITCSVDCVEDESWCPENATCTYGNEKSDGTLYYPATECPAEAQTCSVETITCNSGYQKYNDNSDVCVLCDANGHVNSENKCLCNAGYYGTDGSCSPCPGLDDGDVTSPEGATAIEQCYIKGGTKGKDMTGTFTYTNPGTSCSYKKTE